MKDVATGIRSSAAQLNSMADQIDPPEQAAPSVSGPVGGTGSWKQTFGEEFTSSALDPTKWRRGDYEKADGYYRDFNSKSTAFYIPELAFLRDGKLVLQAVKRKTNVVIVSGTDKRKGTFVRGATEDTFYSTWDLQRTLVHQSGAITTAGDRWGMVGPAGAAPTHSFRYGFFEASIQVPKGKGYWPAFWTKEVTNANDDELDALEIVDPAARHVAHHLHWGPKDSRNDWTGVPGIGWPSGVDLSAGFHTYGVNWQPDRIDWYFDGKIVQSCTDKAKIPQSYQYLIVNLAIGGDWPGYPDASTVFPAEMQIDWIRVWQKA